MNTFHTIFVGTLGGLSMGIFHSYITHTIITKQNMEFDHRMRLLDDQMEKMKQQMKILRIKCLWL